MLKPLLAATILTLIIAVACSAQTARAQDKDQITEVTLERTACFGTCPAYKVTLRSDGTIIYEGREFVEMKGTYKGEVYAFDRLARFILAQGFFNLKDDYSINATDLPSAITSVVRGGKRKKVLDYGGAGPLELWGIEMAIDGVLKNAKLTIVPPVK
jgi:hypothetical protein